MNLRIQKMEDRRNGGVRKVLKEHPLLNRSINGIKPFLKNAGKYFEVG